MTEPHEHLYEVSELHGIRCTGCDEPHPAESILRKLLANKRAWLLDEFPQNVGADPYVAQSDEDGVRLTRLSKEEADYLRTLVEDG